MNLEFDVTTQLFSLKNAQACVMGCKDVYEREPDIQDVATDIQVRVIRGRCALRNAWVGFFFRGTFNLPGWYRDFDPTVVEFNSGWAHRKTTESVNAVLGKIKMAVENKKDAIFIGGHSKGAREAQNCANQLFDDGWNVKQVYTFGTPRGFDFFAAREYDRCLGQRSFRFVNGSDIVCRVPMPPLWCHAGQEVFMPVSDVFGAFHSADYKLNPWLPYKLACDGRELFREWRRTVPMFNDHHIPAYLSAVNALK